jgi:hypothetical protein
MPTFADVLPTLASRVRRASRVSDAGHGDQETPVGSRRVGRRLCNGLGLAAALAVLAAPASVRAGDFAVGLDVGAVVPTDRGFTVGAGVDARFGYRLPVGPVWLQPELDGGFRRIETLNIGRMTAGVRFGLGGLVEPQLQIHGGAAFGDVPGSTFDGGGTVDVHVSVVTVGVHGGVALVAERYFTLHWLDVGVHAMLFF